MNDKVSVAAARPTTAIAAEVEQALIGGDLAKLKPEERVSLYVQTCKSVGLNHLTRPFEYVVLNGKMVLYARKDATDQLRAIHGVSVSIVSREKVGEVYVVTARATTPSGRHDESTGCVSLGKASGDALANLYMKAETKAKRRVTLSICGLGFLDEGEIDAIPGARVVTAAEAEREACELTPPAATVKATREVVLARLQKALDAAGIVDAKRIHFIKESFPKADGWAQLSQLDLETLEVKLREKGPSRLKSLLSTDNSAGSAPLTPEEEAANAVDQGGKP